MKILTVISILTAFNIFASNDVFVGMKFDDFKNIYKDNEKVKYNSQFGWEEKIYEIKGNVYYNFKNEILEWYGFSSYNDELTKENFDNCLSSTKSIINDFTKKYGKPLLIKHGKEYFVNPYDEHHWGYNVLKAYFLTDKEKIEVDFHFMGGKGEYSLLVKIEWQSLNYKYMEIGKPDGDFNLKIYLNEIINKKYNYKDIEIIDNKIILRDSVKKSKKELTLTKKQLEKIKKIINDKKLFVSLNSSEMYFDICKDNLHKTELYVLLTIGNEQIKTDLKVCSSNKIKQENKNYIDAVYKIIKELKL